MEPSRPRAGREAGHAGRGRGMDRRQPEVGPRETPRLDPEPGPGEGFQRGWLTLNPPIWGPTPGGVPDSGQTESGQDVMLMRGCPEQEESGGEMKGHCPNCNRQPVSNALAASISEPASHGSWLGQAWADGCLPGPLGGSRLAAEPGTSKDPRGTEPKAILTQSRFKAPADTRVIWSLALSRSQLALLQKGTGPTVTGRVSLILLGSCAQSPKPWVTGPALAQMRSLGAGTGASRPSEQTPSTHTEVQSRILGPITPYTQHRCDLRQIVPLSGSQCPSGQI